MAYPFGFTTAGTPSLNVSGITGPTGFGSSNGNGDGDKSNYSHWNGDWKGYLEWMASNGDQASLDRLLNYLMSEQSAQNARDWTASREDSAYQRLVADLKAAGINPYAFATFGASPISSPSDGRSYSGSYSSSYEINKEKTMQNWLKIALSSFVPILGGIIAAML